MTTNGNTALAVHHEQTYSPQQMALLKDTLSPGNRLSNDELALLVEIAKRTGLDPFRKQLYAIRRGGRLTFQVGIDGLRSIAVRSGHYEGQVGPFWCGADGTWKDVWLQSTPPAAAKVGVYRRGCREPIWAVARFSAYAQDNLWKTMPEVMIGKCAEALALRKAFPEDASGLYAEEEMDQATTVPHDPETGEVRETPSQPPPGPSPLSVARFDQRRAELMAAQTLDALRKVGTAISADAKTTALTLEQQAQLRELAKARKATIVEREKAVKQAADDAALDIGSDPAGIGPGKGRVEDTASGRTTFAPGWDQADSPPPADVELDDDMPGRM